jgi:hypothetical protein
MSLRSSAIYENRINKGIYLGTPVWFLGSDPLNLGSMTRFDKFSRGTHLPLSKCFLQNINFANKNKNYGYGGPLQPTTTSVMTHRICFFPAMHPTPITPVKKRQSNSSSIQVKRRLDLPLQLPRRRRKNGAPQAAVGRRREIEIIRLAAGVHCTNKVHGWTSVGYYWFSLAEGRTAEAIERGCDPATTQVDAPSFPTLDLDRSALGRRTRHRSRFRLRRPCIPTPPARPSP